MLGYGCAFGLLAVAQSVVAVSVAVGLLGLDVAGPLPALLLVAVLAAVVALTGPAFSVVTGMTSAVSDCASTGHLLRYVVLFDAGLPAPQAARAVRAACGTTAAYYPQIGVGVVTSAEPTFKARFGTDHAYSAQAEALASAPDADAEAICDHLLSELAYGALDDDVALLVVRVLA